MRRSSAYVAISTTLATAVTSYAFIERPNFYSAAVYLSQSSACLIIISNAALVYFAGLMYGLQQLLFGTLRPIEIEQLWERGWIAGTEWLFALSIFRDDFGVAYMASFILLFVSKIWGWMVDGRLDILEQQNPANATKFHSRLLVATTLNVLLPLKMASYCFEEAMYGPRSGIMTMFTFEFGILLIGAISTTLRYGLWYYEYRLVQKQLKARMEEVRRDAVETGDPVLPLGDLDVHDLDLPGWEAKSSFQFALDIGTDFLKFAAYLTFFGVLTVLYGLPIYIVRDLYMTGRSFYNRVNDYRQYRSATRNMHKQYADASVESLASDNTCIVCREDMKPWIGTVPESEQAISRTTGNFATNERQRPKQLPCGHILHFSCLRSWLERQQACPICRRSVLRPTNRSTSTTQPQTDDANERPQNLQDTHHVNQRQAHPRAQGARAGPRGWGFRLGPFRFFFGRFDGEQALERIRQVAAGGRQRQGPPRLQQEGPTAPGHGVVPAAFVPRSLNAPVPSMVNRPVASMNFPFANEAQQGDEGQQFTRSLQAHSLHSHLTALEDIIRQDIQSLNLAEQRIQCIQWLLYETERARAAVTAHQADIRPIPISGTGHAELAPSQPASTTASQVILDRHGHILTTLPEGWNVVPLDPISSTGQTRPQYGITGIGNTATSVPMYDSLTSLTPAIHPSHSETLGQGASKTRAQQKSAQGPSSDDDITAGVSIHRPERNTTKSPPSDPLITKQTTDAESVHDSNMLSGANATANRAMGFNNDSTQQYKATSDGVHSSIPSWSFDNVPTNNASERSPDDSRISKSSSEPRHSQNGSASLPSSLNGRALQPTIEDLQDEDLD